MTVSSIKLERERQSRKRWLASLLGEPVENVTLSGYTEPVEPIPARCGVGRSAECCAFLTADATGFNCERGGRLELLLTTRAQKGEMIACRLPREPYPQCMKFPATEESESSRIRGTSGGNPTPPDQPERQFSDGC